MGYSNNLLGGNVSKLTRSEDGCHQIHTGACRRQTAQETALLVI